MTLAEVRLETQKILGDEGTTSFTVENLNQAVDWACREAARQTGLTVSKVSYTGAIGAQEALLPDPAIGALSVLMGWS